MIKHILVKKAKMNEPCYRKSFFLVLNLSGNFVKLIAYPQVNLIYGD